MLYTLVAVIGPISLVYIPSRLFGPGPDSLADRIRANENLLRLGIASELIYQVIEVFLVLVLYSLFRDVSRPLARQMAVLGLLPIPMVLLNVVNHAAALILAGGGAALLGMGADQRDGLAALFLQLHQRGLQVATLFWGLWLVPLGLLFIRCGFVPRVIGWSALLGATGYVISTFTALTLPLLSGTLGTVGGWLQVGELPVVLWLLIVGARFSRRTQPFGDT